MITRSATKRKYPEMFNNNDFFEGIPFKNPVKLNFDWAKVDDALFIGSAHCLSDEKFLNDNKIELIINASNRESNKTPFNIPTIRVLDIDDIVPSPKDTPKFTTDLKAKTISVVEQIHVYISKNKNVLVHCQAGINRSAFILAMYMITKRGYEPSVAIKKIKQANAEQRSIVALSNPLFEAILLTIKRGQ